MKERPILFSAPMVRAILDGSKTQTRRVVKPCKDLNFGCLLHPREIAGEINAGDYSNSKHGQPGDRLWVRETWQGPILECDEHFSDFRQSPDTYKNPGFCAYRATDKLDAVNDDGKELGWRPSIHMPRWASRINLEIIGIRVDLLQSISESDAMAEGVRETGDGAFHIDDDIFRSPQASETYARLWESINGPGSWLATAFVWVIEFKRVEA